MPCCRRFWTKRSRGSCSYNRVTPDNQQRIFSVSGKLIYLLLGILVKQTIDEFKAIAKQNADDLERQKERAATYVPNPALAAGSAAVNRVIAQAQHAEAIRPYLAKLTRKQRLWKYAPFAVYLLLTTALFLYALVMPDATSP